MRNLLLTVMLTFVASLAAPALADEVGELKKEIEKQYDLLLRMQTRIAELESAQKTQDKAITEKIAAEVEKKQTAAFEPISWTKNIKLSGDFRYRYEGIRQENDGKPDVHHNRIRARLMLEAIINNEWDLGFRLATGSSPDPISTNQTLGQSFANKPVWIDLAYVRYRPEWIEGVEIYGGKMRNPFYQVGGNQLIWDNDLTPEGGALKYTRKLTDQTTFYTNLGAFWIDAGPSTSLFGAQSYVRHNLASGDHVIAGLSYFDYGNIKGRGNLRSTWDSRSSFYGNTSAGGVFANDYDIMEVFAEYGTKIGDLPVAVFGDVAKNLAATTSEDFGWLIGTKIGRARNPGSWEVFYNYRDLQADAVLGAMSDSDFIGGGTGGRGHQFGLVYQVSKNVQAGLSYYLAELDRTPGRTDDYRRLQIDLMYRF